jgi:3-deoxy-7-phosphoheptulonate synthase
MIIQLNNTTTSTQKSRLIDELNKYAFGVQEVATKEHKYLIAQGGAQIDIRSIGNKSYVQDIHIVQEPYPLVSSSWKEQSTVISLNEGVQIGRKELSIIAGPCTVENEEQIDEMAKFLVAKGIKLMRGGIFKPRSSPYSYQGLGIEGLKLFHQTAHKNGMQIVTEIMEQNQIEKMYSYVDVFQVGARNAQNYKLLGTLGKVDKPILLKRGFSQSLDELLHAAEYIFTGGNEQIILCERGIRTFEKSYRNTLDINAIPVLKQKSHLPVFIDPSHGIGLRNHVANVALGCIMAGADGVLVEIHKQPQKAVSDGFQSLSFSEFSQLVENSRLTFQLKNKINKSITN